MRRPPMYEVIYQDLASQITSGALPTDTRLPSEAELAERYGVSRMTVRQALGQLESEQLLVRRRGAGTFVAEPRAARYRRMNRLGPFKEDLGLDDVSIGTQLLVQDVVEPPDDVRRRLKLKPRQRAIHIRRIRLVDRTPAAVQDSWLPYALAPALARGGLVEGSLYRTLAERCGVELGWAEQEISASAASAEQANWLDVKEGSPLIAITRLAYADGLEPVEFAQSWTRPEFPLLIRLER